LKNPAFKLTVFVMLILSAVWPALGQEPLGPGEGKPIILGGSDFATFNPLLAADGGSSSVVGHLYPNFIGMDPDSGALAPGAANALAAGWILSDDNRTLTVTLRDDRTWSDGVPMTSADIKYAYDAIVSGQTDSVYESFLAPIQSLEAPDDYTVVITFRDPSCTALFDASTIPVVPAHHFSAIFPAFSDISFDHPSNFAPEVTGGAFQFGSYVPGEQLVLPADQNYPDSPAGYVVPESVIYKAVGDIEDEYQRFLNGEITLMLGTPENRNLDSRMRAAQGEFHLIDRPTDGWMVLLFNLADPSAPQPGLDPETGERIVQSPHPVLGSLAVRQAISRAIDFEALNAGAFASLGMPVAGPMPPQSWAFNDRLPTYEFDLAKTHDLLEEAGWTDHDGDNATPRIATEQVGTVEPGAPLQLDLTIFTDAPAVEIAGELIAGQLGAAGFDIRLERLDFNTVVTDLVAQTHDMTIIYWGVSASRPQDMYDQLGLEGDLPENGFNTGSYYNEAFENVMQAARTLPGCDEDERKEFYDRAQEIIHDTLPYYILNAEYMRVIVQNEVENFEPKENSVLWNLPAWSIR
jgi:peptide/nickel transport system substrate-binding protein